MKTKICLFLIGLNLLAGTALAEPTESRTWTSITGTRVTGSALQIKSGKVQLKLDSGKTIAVDLKKLSDQDQEFLTEHFGENTAPAAPAEDSDEATAKAKDSGTPFVTEGLDQEIGKVLGPIDAGGGSTYFLYIPKSLREDRDAALLHFNGSGGGNAGSVKSHIEGAELNGWIVAASVQSKNGKEDGFNLGHAQRDVAHLLETLPIDEERVYFTGGSGGGAQSFLNVAEIKSAGAIPHIGYIPNGVELKDGHFFIVSGTTDYNRYHSASAVEAVGSKNAIQRFHVGGHKMGPNWLRTEGMAWLNGRYLEKNSRDAKFFAERLDYEAAMIAWITAMREEHPHRAYYWCVFLQDSYKISGENAKVLAPITAELAANPGCTRYVEGIEAISDFSKKNYSSIPGGSLFKHSTPKITKASEKLAEKYAGTPMIEDIANELGKPTVGK